MTENDIKYQLHTIDEILRLCVDIQNTTGSDTFNIRCRIHQLQDFLTALYKDNHDK